MTSFLKRLICSCLFVILSASVAFAQVEALQQQEEYLRNTMQAWETPGMAISVVKDDSLIFARGYGVRSINTGMKVDEETLFAVASNTKAFTAALLGMLVQEGKLTWDDRVADRLPDFQLFDPYVTREVRIRDLLTHRTGLPVFGGDDLWIGGGVSREHIIHQLRYLEPNAPFRAAYQYNNLMWLVAGQVYAKASEESWDTGIKRRIFEPLAMSHSNTSVTVLAAPANFASPHEKVKGKLAVIEFDNVDTVAPAAAINSNVVDMAQWMRLNLSQGRFGPKEILRPDIIAEMQSLQIPTRISAFSEQHLGVRFKGYGLGWGVTEYKGHKMVTHSGGLSGMISLQTLLPEQNLGVMVLTNRAPNALPWVVSYRILDLLLNEAESDWNEILLKRRDEADGRKARMEQELLSQRVQNTSPSLALKQYSGDYANDFSGPIKIRIENEHLVFDYKPRYIGDLEHWHYNTFRVTWRHPIFDMEPQSFLTFNLNESGSVSDLTVTFYDPVRFTKRPSLNEQ